MDLWTDLSGLAFGLGVAILALTLAIRFDGAGALRRRVSRRSAAKAAQGLPFPVWLTNRNSDKRSEPDWANDAYHRLPAEDRSAITSGTGRVAIGAGATRNVVERRLIGDIGFALPCDELVRAEGSLRDLMQTMTQTFAQLPLGLAVFDEAGRLSSFNPVLADLTGLSPSFLSRKPSLTAMLDAMRDRSMVPEPADWKAWRAGLANMERAAAKGTFEDTWALPGGQTYRVTGRQHRSGGLSLLIEDISPEISRGRRYRASLDLCQSVIDHVDEAIAVFAPSGKLVIFNLAYSALWQHDPRSGIAQLDLGQATGLWRAASAPTALWTELEMFNDHSDERQPWHAEVRLTDGRLIRCRCEPLAEGAMLVGFSVLPAEGPKKTIVADSA